MAMNMYVQGIDPQLDFSHIDRIREMYERCTKMRVPERQPYAGDLVFTAFSGSHQDAINKGFNYMKETGTDKWMVPYLPIDPTDLGREYEPVRINSQSGKGGAAFIMNHKFGFDMPKTMHGEFGAVVQAESDRVGKELKPDRIMELFEQEYLKVDGPYQLVKHAFHEETVDGHSQVTFFGTIRHKDTVFSVNGEGNGPIDAFFNAIHGQKMDHLCGLQVPRHHQRLRLRGRGLYPAAGPHRPGHLRGGSEPQHQPGPPPGHPVRHQPLEAHPAPAELRRTAVT